MTKLKGFKLGRRLVRICRWVIRPKRRPDGYQRLSAPDCQTKMMTKICNWGRRLKRGAKVICSSKVLCSSRSDAPDAYTRMDSDGFIPKRVEVPPKGHLAVYVGQKDDDPHRFLVPVFYFNHPLFGELLRDAEKEYGFDHPGGITIPCPVAEFENVQTKIAAGKNLLWKRRLSPGF